MPLETTLLGRSCGGLVALPGLSLTVAAGECAALIGADGSGKSTAVRTIMLVSIATAGTGAFGGSASAATVASVLGDAYLPAGLLAAVARLVALAPRVAVH